MPTEYTVVEFVFDWDAFAAMISARIESIGVETIAVLTGADVKTLEGWSKGKYAPNYPYPSMTLFLRVCNALDLDPRAYFVLAE